MLLNSGGLRRPPHQGGRTAPGAGTANLDLGTLSYAVRRQRLRVDFPSGFDSLVLHQEKYMNTRDRQKRDRRISSEWRRRALKGVERQKLLSDLSARYGLCHRQIYYIIKKTKVWSKVLSK